MSQLDALHHAALHKLFSLTHTHTQRESHNYIMTLILRDQPAPDVDVVKETPEFITVELLLSGVKLLMNVCNSQMYLNLSTLMR